MNKDQKNEKQISELRKKAENKIDRSRDKSELEHELDVYKVELEMQNHELLYTQQKLIVSLDAYAQLFNLAPLSYFVLDKNGVILDLNYTAYELLGINKNNILGKYFSLFLNGMNLQDDYYRHRNTVIETEKPQQIESEIILKDGKIIPVLIESTVVKDFENNFKHFLSTIVDISQRKAHEKQLESSLIKEKDLNKLKSRFVSTASHEFRTPLSAVLSSIEIIEKHLENNETHKCKKHIHRIKESVFNLTEILNDFLSLDKLESGQITSILKYVDVTKLTKKTIDEAKPTLKEGQKIEYTHLGNTNFNMDPKIFHSILLNLLSNASKYSGDKKVITLNVKASHEKINIEVKDQGIGIPEDDQKNIFSRLFRAKNAEAIGGTGLGLNILKKYIELSNGKICFESKENIGSTFYVEIPAELKA